MVSRQLWVRGRTFVATFLPRSAVILAILTLGAYVMGLVRDRVFTHTFGLGPELDAYNAAFVLPELALDVLVAGGLVAPFVPLFTGLRVGRKPGTEPGVDDEATGYGEDAAAAFGRTILTLAVLVMAIAAAILFVFASQTVELIAPGFQGSQRELYTNLFRIMCVTPVIFAASIVLGEILVAERRFVAYGLAPLFYNGGIVAGTLLLADRIGIYGAAIGAVAGALLHLGIRLVGIRRSSFRVRPSLAIRTPAVGSFIRLMIPKMASHPIEPLTFLYFTAIASNLEPGSIASVSLARNFQSVAVSLIGAAFSIAAFPALSAAAAALGDRRGFSRLFGRTFATILGLTLVAALGVFLVGGFVIRLFLGGGAFDDDAIDRTTALLLVFAISIPLESLTHLLSRAIYATRNTLVPSAASVTGFVATVISADALLPSLAVAAIPASFAIGMAVKVTILGIALVPRIRGIGTAPGDAAGMRNTLARPMAAPFVGPFAGPTAVTLARRTSTRRRLTTVVLAVAVLGLGLGAVRAASLVISTNTLGLEPAITPWVRSAAPAATEPPASEVPILAEASSSAPAGPTSPGASGSGPGSSSAPPTPSPTPGPFKMDLYEKGDYVGEQYDTWCLPAAMQTSMNIMDVGADTTLATQRHLFNLARSIDPAPDGAAEPEAWAAGLGQLGYGKYEVSVQPTIRAAVQLAAKRIRATNRPAGFMVWRGAHSWVMSGFTATADPALTDQFLVTAVRIEDVWYPRLSSIWGESRPPDALVAVKDLAPDFLPWKRPQGQLPGQGRPVRDHRPGPLGRRQGHGGPRAQRVSVTLLRWRGTSGSRPLAMARW